MESHCKFSVNQVYKIQQDPDKWRHNVEKFDNHLRESLACNKDVFPIWGMFKISTILKLTVNVPCG